MDIARKKLTNLRFSYFNGQMNHLIAAVKAAMNHHGVTQMELAAKAQMHRSQVSNLLQGGLQTVSSEMLTTLVNAWPEPETGLDILRAHLSDEIIRAGRNLDEIAISVAGVAETPKLDIYLAAIQRDIAKEPDLRTVIEYFGEIILADAKASQPAPVTRNDPQRKN